VLQRRQVLHSITAISVLLEGLAATRQVPLSVDDGRDLLLLRQAARMMAGGEADEAAPVNAPPWLLARWRALSSTLPIEDPLPEIPYPPDRTPFLRAGLMALLDQAGIMPGNMPLVLVRAQLLDAITRKALAAELPAILPDGLRAHPRELLLTRLILAASRRWRPADPSQLLVDDRGQMLPLVSNDCLVYALTRLMLKRLAIEAPAMQVLPAGLEPYAQLLSGRPEAMFAVFGQLTAYLPPEQLLAAALAMQEVESGKADWNLLATYPSMVLPLSLLVPEP
jgi:hypothetical protein